MNNLLFVALIVILLYYFFYYLPQQKSAHQSPPKLTHSQGTQTDLSDKQITNLITQWNQVAEWAKEEKIDVNKKWNLLTLKNKVNSKFSNLENTLDELLKNIQDLNKELDHDH